MCMQNPLKPRPLNNRDLSGKRLIMNHRPEAAAAFLLCRKRNALASAGSGSAGISAAEHEQSSAEILSLQFIFRTD